MNVHNIQISAKTIHVSLKLIENKQKKKDFFVEKRGAGLEKQLSCPKLPITFDNFSEILKSLNVLQKKTYLCTKNERKTNITEPLHYRLLTLMFITYLMYVHIEIDRKQKNGNKKKAFSCPQ